MTKLHYFLSISIPLRKRKGGRERRGRREEREREGSEREGRGEREGREGLEHNCLHNIQSTQGFYSYNKNRHNHSSKNVILTNKAIPKKRNQYNHLKLLLLLSKTCHFSIVTLNTAHVKITLGIKFQLHPRALV